MLKRCLPVLDTQYSLLKGAVAISSLVVKGCDLDETNAQIQGYVDKIRSRVRGRQFQAKVAHLHDVLFAEEGFRGNTEDYYSPLNSCLPVVLQTKRGMPITLSLIYKLVAERLGLHVHGIALPGHFLIGLKQTWAESDDQVMIIDPFAGGRILSLEETHARVKQMFGQEYEWSPDWMRPADQRHWLTRILQNLLNIFGSTGKYADVAAVLEMEMLLWPEMDHLQRDLGLILARSGHGEAAIPWLDRYLEAFPEDPQAPQLRELLKVLGPGQSGKPEV